MPWSRLSGAVLPWRPYGRQGEQSGRQRPRRPQPQHSRRARGLQTWELRPARAQRPLLRCAPHERRQEIGAGSRTGVCRGRSWNGLPSGGRSRPRGTHADGSAARRSSSFTETAARSASCAEIGAGRTASSRAPSSVTIEPSTKLQDRFRSVRSGPSLAYSPTPSSEGGPRQTSGATSLGRWSPLVLSQGYVASACGGLDCGWGGGPPGRLCSGARAALRWSRDEHRGLIPPGHGSDQISLPVPAARASPVAPSTWISISSPSPKLPAGSSRSAAGRDGP